MNRVKSTTRSWTEVFQSYKTWDADLFAKVPAIKRHNSITVYSAKIKRRVSKELPDGWNSTGTVARSVPTCSSEAWSKRLHTTTYDTPLFVRTNVPWKTP